MVKGKQANFPLYGKQLRLLWMYEITQYKLSGYLALLTTEIKNT